MKIGLGLSIANVSLLAGTPTPPQENLALWVRADQGVTQSGGVISEWADLRANGRSFAQATPAWQPAFEAAGFNGRPSIAGDGVDDYLQTSYALNQPCTVIFALQHLEALLDVNPIDGLTVNTLRIRRYTTGNFYFYADGAGTAAGPSSGVVSTDTNVITMCGAGTSGFVQFNGAHRLTYPGGSSTPGGLVLFTLGNLTGFTKARISEVLVYTGILDPAVLLAAERYVGAQNGVLVA